MLLLAVAARQALSPVACNSDLARLLVLLWLMRSRTLNGRVATYSQAFTYAIERSCINKAEVVAADEKEGGVRATLNLGHTFGHAIETCTGGQILTYGALLDHAFVLPRLSQAWAAPGAGLQSACHGLIHSIAGECMLRPCCFCSPANKPCACCCMLACRRLRRLASWRGCGSRHHDGGRHVLPPGLD